MKRVFAPTRSGSDWQRLLARPTLHWKKGRSAMTAAACWDAAGETLPTEINSVLRSTEDPDLADLELLAVLPEWKVRLKGGKAASHTDVLALACNSRGLVVLAVEAKVAEGFGPTLGAKRAGSSSGQRQRLDYLHSVLRLSQPLTDSIRYQLFHRTASALLSAQAFHAHVGVMVVHSFSPESRGRDDYEAFCRAIEARSVSDAVWIVPSFAQPRLFLAWCSGEQRFRDVDLTVI